MTYITAANYAEEALVTMKSRPANEDGTIGVTLVPEMPEWRPWLCYFIGKRFDAQADFMRQRAKAGYMVPTRSPAEFDPTGVEEARRTYALRLHHGEVKPEDTGILSSEMAMEQRMDVLRRLCTVLPWLRENVGRGE